MIKQGNNVRSNPFIFFSELIQISDVKKLLEKLWYGEGVV